MSSQSQSMSHQQFLLVAANLLNRCLLEPTRADAKQRFRGLQEGRVLALETIEMEDKSLAQFGLSLDASEFRGKLNFGAFRASLQALIGNISAKLKDDGELTTFAAQEHAAALIFGIVGLTVEAQQPNALVLGTEPAAEGQGTLLKLMYLDPAQFLSEEAG